ncbi:MAG: CBS domain-containing protein, partial [Cellvibrionaceae bacterium]|nr:CBS domain-containing protein [Cellvibrionaceae bacterium]
IFVTDYMNNKPSVVSTTTNVRDAVELMLKHRITGVPVIDDDKNLVGYLSEQDCIEEMLNDAFYCEEPAAVSKVMQTELLTVTPKTSIVELAQTIIKNRPKNYPVIEAGKLVGLINRTQVLQALVENDDDCYLRQ